MEVDLQRLELLNRIFSQVMGEIFHGSPANEALNDITMIQKRVLFALHLHGSQKMSDIAHMASLSLPSATAVVDKMVRAGLVEREGDPEDRRVVRVIISEQGRKVLTEMGRFRKQRLKDLLNCLQPEKQAELVASFEKIYELLQEIRAAKDMKEAAG